ncbi:MAG: ABC transporter ATP-binding protein, partial [Phycisphaeraceae bacterium]|nr:ABC transporter ATP-binding protein [Phycisphaeraceae bacterium]
LIMALVAIAIMFFLSGKLTLIVLTGVSLYVFNYKWFVRRIRKVQKRFRSKMDRLSARAQERLAGSILVQAYNSQRNERRVFTRANFLTERVNHRFRQLNNAYGMTSSALTWTTFATVQLFGTYMVIHNQITYGAVLAVSAYTWRLLTPAVQLAELSNQLEQTKISLDRIVELMQGEKDFICTGGTQLEKLKGHVTFENLSFHYDLDSPVLKNINLDVKPGQIVAFVGETGCGKSTSISLIYHYYQATGGRLLIDGHDITTLDTRWYRNQLAMVPQDPIVLDDTLANNIAYGDPNASMDRIHKAADMAELNDIIKHLPDGIQTLLGEEGAKLSVGERQRLCIARAILKDPTILILDEATSSLDPQSEALIQKALNRVMSNRTTFIIAHRLSTIVHADIIVVLDQGHIIEQGTHAQLFNNKQSRYRHLFDTQMASTTHRPRETA